MGTTKIEKLDPNFASESGPADLTWTDARELGIEGQAFSGTAAPFDRLPAEAHGRVSDAVWELQHHSAGMAVRFRTAAPEIGVRWSLVSPEIASSHMAATGVSGVDLYAEIQGRPRFASVGRPTVQEGNVSRLPGSQDDTPWGFQLNFPLYNGITSLESGVPVGVAIEPLREPARKPAICFYGTSIVQGGCASRPGMAYPAIICRELGVEQVNLGFSGNARAEPEMTELLARLDPRAFVLDPLPNMQADTIVDRLGHMVRTLRRSHPATPIIIVEHVRPTRLSLPWDRQWSEEWARCNALLGTLLRSLDHEGTPGLHVVSWRNLMGDDNEATVDGIHPTDLGFARMAEVIGPVVKKAVRMG
jgi:lysophospholipase L1-like esterase